MSRQRFVALVLAATAVLAIGPAATWAARMPPELAQAVARDGSVPVIVRLADPGDDPGAAARAQAEGLTHDRWREREIARVQAALSAALAGSGTIVRRAFRSAPFVALQTGSAGLAALEASAQVVAIGRDPVYRPLLNQSVPLVGAPDAWQAGADGTGWSIAIIDTGVDAQHPFLRDKVLAEACFTRDSCPNGQEGPGAAAPCDDPLASCGHGTHVAGIAAGLSPAANECADAGVARGASLIAIQVFSRTSGEECRDSGQDPCIRTSASDVAAALEYLHGIAAGYRIAAVNLSLGGDQFTSQDDCAAAPDGQLITAVLQPLLEDGIAIVAAAGNKGLPDALAAPACLPSVISVGATDIEDRVAPFSNSASFLALLAPGTGETIDGQPVGICSAAPDGRAAGAAGTSQASPHVAGAFAILRQARPTATTAEILAALRATGRQIDDPKSSVVTPRIQIAAALQQLTSAVRSSGIQITPDGGYRLVSKPLDEQRWAIARNGDDATVTGNVYSSDGGDPVFLWCMEIPEDDGTTADQLLIRYSCAVSGPCTSATCPAPGDWSPAGDVQIPRSFFEAPTLAGAAQQREASPSGSVASHHDSARAARRSGLQVTPDGKRVLISKPVGDQRWAITQNRSDQSVTGNVYFPAGGEPQFIACRRIADDGNPDPYARAIRFSCLGAPPCSGPICPGAADWTTISDDVSLPGAFFLPDRAP